MKICVRGHDLGKSDEKTVARLAKELGFDGIQLAINKSIPGETAMPGELSDERIKEIADAIAKEGLETPLLGSYFNPVHSNKALVQKNMDKFKFHLKFSSVFGTKYVGSETGSYNDDKWTYNPNNRTEEAFQEVKAKFKELIDYAKEVNSNLAIEGADGHCMYCPQQLYRLLREIDNGHMFITVDIYNYLNEENYSKEYQHRIVDECIELFQDKIKIIHLKDFTMDEKPLLKVGLGEGLMDLEYIIHRFYHACSSAYLIFEGVPKEKMESSLRYIKMLLDKEANKSI